MKKILIWAGIALALALAAFILISPTIRVDVPESKVRSELALKLPMTIDRNGVNVIVRAATVDFLDSNAVRLTAEADLAGFGLSGSASTDATSGLRYENGNFYLTELTFSDVDFALDGESSSRVDDAKDVASAAFGRLRAKLDSEVDGAGAALDRLSADATAKAEPILRDAVDRALRSIPVYSLNGRDMKHDLAALALENVTFSEEAAHADLSPGKALLHIIISIALIFIAVGAAVGMIFVAPRSTVALGVLGN